MNVKSNKFILHRGLAAYLLAHLVTQQKIGKDGNITERTVNKTLNQIKRNIKMKRNKFLLKCTVSYA